MRASFFIILNIHQRRLNHPRNFSNLRPNFWNMFSREVPCMAPVIATTVYTVLALIFHKKNCLEIDHKWYLCDLLDVSEVLCELRVKIFAVKHALVFLLLLYFYLYCQMMQSILPNFAKCVVNMMFKSDFLIKKETKMFLNIIHLTWWIDAFFFLENETSCAGLFRSGLKSIFQLKPILRLKIGHF